MDPPSTLPIPIQPQLQQQPHSPNGAPQSAEPPLKKPKQTRRTVAKKVSRACNHCRKAHMTCDESRPCKRCSSRGLSDSCADAPRKTKKYLLDLSDGKNDNNSPLLVNNGLNNVNGSLLNQTNPQLTSINGLPLPLPNSQQMIPGTSNTNPAFITPSPNNRFANITNQRPSIDNITSPPLVSDRTSSINSTDETSTKRFMSSAADLEYSILGSIIQQDFLSPDSNSNNNGNQGSNAQFMSPAASNSNSEDTVEYLNYQPLMYQHQPLFTPTQYQLQEQQQQQQPLQHHQLQQLRQDQQNFSSPTPQDHQRTYLPTSLPSTDNNINPQYGPWLQPLQQQQQQQQTGESDIPVCDASTNQYFLGSMESNVDGKPKVFTFPEVVKMISSFRNMNPLQFHERNKRSAISFSIGILDDDSDQYNYLNHNNDTSSSTSAITTPSQNATTLNDKSKFNTMSNTERYYCKPTKPSPCGLHFTKPSAIYSRITKPFSYVKPYHDLNLYLRSRFDKEPLVSMSKSMSEYRPSFIAGMIHLTEDDMIFAEQCFQRTLLEYDNYISISGTPTLVWRRTSQIAYVGDEFCILTGWSKDALLGKSTFAVEIMDDKSCVEYFQLFSKIAFGDFRGATMTECTLLTPNGESIRTSCIWTLKRDVFGIPMMIIANFLPILT